MPEEGASLDSASRAVPIGVARRRDPARLREDAIVLGGLFHDDQMSILAGVVAASAVAASCFGQSGRDLIGGVLEACEPAAAALGPVPANDSPLAGIARLTDHVGVADGEEALLIAAGGGDPGL